MEDNKYITEIGEINVKVRQGDLTVVFTDAIVNPASPDGAMADGVSGAIKQAGGKQIEREVRSKAPIAPGRAVSTGAGDLSNLHVIHTPTADKPGGASNPEMITAAMRAALEEAEKIECETLAVPGMGTGVGKVPAGDAAQAMLEAIKAHTPTMVNDIILIDRNDEMVDAFIKALEQFDEENE
jgi:O-acetyl-ADP-ribose deacetylase (regulator of RNase III)